MREKGAEGEWPSFTISVVVKKLAWFLLFLPCPPSLLALSLRCTFSRGCDNDSHPSMIRRTRSR